MFMPDVKREKVQLTKAMFSNKLGKKIGSEILMPILQQLEDDYPSVIQDAAEYAQMRIVEFMENSTPSGKTYNIYAYDPDAPRGQRNTLLRTHTASAPGEVPAKLTGTLISAIDYRITSDGSFVLGLLKKPGEYSDALSELESAFYKGGNIVMSPGMDVSSMTPVGTYGDYLTTGTENMAARPFFGPAMNSIREDLRQRIRKNIRKSLNSITRRISVRRAIVFKVYFRE